MDAIASKLSSHSFGFSGVRKIGMPPPIPVGAGLPAKAWCQSLQGWLNGRHREQAQLPQFFRVFGCSQDRHATANPCGSGLAREGVVSVTSRLAEPTPSRASSAPTVFQVFARSACHRQSPVGAGLLAKAWCQSLQGWLNRRHREQAQLPQFRVFGCSQDRHATANPLWERACPRRRGVSHFKVG